MSGEPERRAMVSAIAATNDAAARLVQDQESYRASLERVAKAKATEAACLRRLVEAMRPDIDDDDGCPA